MNSLSPIHDNTLNIQPTRSKSIVKTDHLKKIIIHIKNASNSIIDTIIGYVPKHKKIKETKIRISLGPGDIRYY